MIHRNRPGFTLLELLVVLTIMGIVLASVPAAFTDMIPGERVRTAAYNLADDLRMARNHAVSTGATTALVLDLAHGSFKDSVTEQSTSLPEGAHLAVESDTEIDHAGGQANIVFFSDGSSTGGDIRIDRGGLTFRIHVDWLTGRVSLAA